MKFKYGTKVITNLFFFRMREISFSKQHIEDMRQKYAGNFRVVTAFVFLKTLLFFRKYICISGEWEYKINENKIILLTYCSCIPSHLVLSGSFCHIAILNAFFKCYTFNPSIYTSFMFK